MSVYAALFSGVSGLQAYSSALGIISDNITNVNTVGYKEAVSRFSTLVTETSSTDTYSPGGVKAAPETLISRQGLLQASNSQTDLGIDGAGFFVVRNAPTAQSTDGEILFTRAGNFAPDELGFLKNTAGHFLMGWPVNASGDIPTNLGDVGALQPIATSNLTGTAEATTDVRIRANLQSSQTINPAIGTYTGTAAGVSMANGSIAPDFERTVQVFDAQGGAHTLKLGALKVAANEWAMEIYADPPGDVTAASGLLAQGTLAFNTDGSLKTTGGAPVTSTVLTSPINITWTNGATASDISFNLGSDGDVDGLTQFDSVSALISSNVNGAVFGNVTGVNIGKDGGVTALFDNGLTRTVFKLPVATFLNPDGLNRRQGNAYGISDQSGNFSLVEAGTGGGGTIAPSTLEASTVDLANEFTNLITVQRAFSASTRIITTADEMLDELNRLRR